MRSKLALALAAVAVAGCARTSSVADAGGAVEATGSSTAGASQSTQAVVTGFVRVYGGPMNPNTGQAAATGAPTPGSQVTIVDATGRKTTTTSDTTGRFTFRLAPGTYKLECSGEVQAQALALLPGTTLEQDCQLDVP